MTIEVKIQRRRAKARLYNKELHDFEEKDCHVLGLLQYIDGDEACAIFVCELFDGTVKDVSSELVRFVDIDGKGGILE